MSEPFSLTPGIPGDPLMDKLREISAEHRGIVVFLPLSDEDGPSSTMGFETEPTFDQLMMLSAKYTACAMLFAEDVINWGLENRHGSQTMARSMRTRKLHAATQAVFKLMSEDRNTKGNQG